MDIEFLLGEDEIVAGMDSGEGCIRSVRERHSECEECRPVLES